MLAQAVGQHQRLGTGVPGVSEARLAFWDAIATGTRSVVFEAPGRRFTQELRVLGESAGIITRTELIAVLHQALVES